MISFDNYSNENKTKHNQNWPYIPDHPYKILITGGWGSGTTNVLLNLIENKPDIDQMYLYAKDLYKAKYRYLMDIRDKVALDHYDDPKAFIEYSNDMQVVYKNIDEYNVDKERKILIASMINNKKLNSIETESFIRGRKLNISPVFIARSYFKVPEDVRLNTTHFFITRILKTRISANCTKSSTRY